MMVWHRGRPTWHKLNLSAAEGAGVGVPHTAAALSTTIVAGPACPGLSICADSSGALGLVHSKRVYWKPSTLSMTEIPSVRSALQDKPNEAAPCFISLKSQAKVALVINHNPRLCHLLQRRL